MVHPNSLPQSRPAYPCRLPDPSSSAQSGPCPGWAGRARGGGVYFLCTCQRGTQVYPGAQSYRKTFLTKSIHLAPRRKRMCTSAGRYTLPADPPDAAEGDGENRHGSAGGNIFPCPAVLSPLQGSVHKGRATGGLRPRLSPHRPYRGEEGSLAFHRSALNHARKSEYSARGFVSSARPSGCPAPRGCPRSGRMARARPACADFCRSIQLSHRNSVCQWDNQLFFPKQQARAGCGESRGLGREKGGHPA